MSDYSQENRLMTFTSSAGDNALLLHSLHAREAISEPFEYTLDLVGFDEKLNLKDLLGKTVTIGLRLFDGTYRPLHGHLVQLTRGGRTRDGLTRYRARVVPWLWFLGLNRDCRIFQNLSTQEIIETVFKEAGFADYELRSLSGGTTARPYCVQYQESSLQFVSRLLEEEGIFYFFEHTEESHVLVLADASVQFPASPAHPSVPIHHDVGALSQTSDAISSLVTRASLHPGKVALGDYNFEQAGVDLGVALSGEGDYEYYAYPGGYAARPQGEERAKVQLEALAAEALLYEGESNCRGFSAGFQLKLEEVDTELVEASLILKSVQFQCTQPLGFGSVDGAASYRNRFEAFPASLAYRPAQRTPRPRISGAQTARVVGKSGEEIWTDRFGRIKVQFHWDRLGKRDENSSCWVRVAGAQAGKQWGSFSLPRIGQEVVVEFLDGDPDRPLVVGTVYNSEMPPPYPLPDDQTRSTFKTVSSKGGAAFNELQFQDLKDSEAILLHAGKDFIQEVVNDARVTIKHDQLVTVENERKLTVKKNETTLVEGTASHTVKKDVTGAIEGALSQTVKGDVKVTISEGAVTFSLDKGDLSVKAGSGAMAFDASSKGVTVKAKTIELTATESLTLKVGSSTVTIESSKVSVVQGGSKVELASTGVTLAGSKISIG